MGEIIIIYNSHMSTRKEGVKMETLEAILVIVYIIAGTWAVKYVKSEIFHVTAVFTTNWLRYHVDQVVWGAFMGWLAIPIALLHRIIFNRN